MVFRLFVRSVVLSPIFDLVLVDCQNRILFDRRGLSLFPAVLFPRVLSRHLVASKSPPSFPVKLVKQLKKYNILK